MVDTATGLPELPEGYFWRVKFDRVEIRKKLRWGSTLECRGYLRSLSMPGTDIAGAILAEAETTADYWRCNRFRDSLVRDSLVGDYPPKKLNTEETTWQL